MRYTNWTETKSLEVKCKARLFLKSRDRILKETVILVLVKSLASLGFSTKES